MPMIARHPLSDGGRRDVDAVPEIESRHDHVVDHPLHGDARRDGAEREHEGTGDGGREVARVHPHERVDERRVATQARERSFLIRRGHGMFLPARRARTTVTSVLVPARWRAGRPTADRRSERHVGSYRVRARPGRYCRRHGTTRERHRASAASTPARRRSARPSAGSTSAATPCRAVGRVRRDRSRRSRPSSTGSSGSTR